MRMENRVRQTLRDGGTVLGAFVPPPSPEMVEICAAAGFDFVLIDAEHGPITPEGAYPMILAAEARGIEALARIGQNDRQEILKYLDLGVAGVMIPQVHTPDLAKAAVEAMRYAPRGARGLAGGRTFDWGLSDPLATMVPQINERVLSIIQFEHISALEHIDDLLATPDLDVLFVGPNDLSHSMGHTGNLEHPEVRAVIDQVTAAAKGGAVALATTASNAEEAKRQIERGFRMIVASATGMLASAARAYVSGTPH